MAARLPGTAAGGLGDRPLLRAAPTPPTPIKPAAAPVTQQDIVLAQGMDVPQEQPLFAPPPGPPGPDEIKRRAAKLLSSRMV